MHLKHNNANTKIALNMYSLPNFLRKKSPERNWITGSEVLHICKVRSTEVKSIDHGHLWGLPIKIWFCTPEVNFFLPHSLHLKYEVNNNASQSHSEY